MRHRKRGRRLGRSSPHRKAMLRNLVISLFLTERDDDWYDDADPSLPKQPKAKGRIVTTVPKAKEVRPLIEKCITLAKKGNAADAEAAQYGTSAERGSTEYIAWRGSEKWQQWQAAKAPGLAARRRVLDLLGNRGKAPKLIGLPAAKEAVAILFDVIAPRYEDRPGGYTRIMQLAQPRLGDAGDQAILELVGVNDRTRRKSEKPAFDDEGPETEPPVDETPAEEEASADAEEAAADEEEEVVETADK